MITARDRKSFELLPEKVKAFADEGVSFICGDDYLQDIDDDIIFKSPGIRYDLPELSSAVLRGSELTSEMELFFELWSVENNRCNRFRRKDDDDDAYIQVSCS